MKNFVMVSDGKKKKKDKKEKKFLFTQFFQKIIQHSIKII